MVKKVKNNPTEIEINIDEINPETKKGKKKLSEIIKRIKESGMKTVLFVSKRIRGLTKIFERNRISVVTEQQWTTHGPVISQRDERSIEREKLKERAKALKERVKELQKELPDLQDYKLTLYTTTGERILHTISKMIDSNIDGYIFRAEKFLDIIEGKINPENEYLLFHKNDFIKAKKFKEQLEEGRELKKHLESWKPSWEKHKPEKYTPTLNLISEEETISIPRAKLVGSEAASATTQLRTPPPIPPKPLKTPPPILSRKPPQKPPRKPQSGTPRTSIKSEETLIERFERLKGLFTDFETLAPAINTSDGGIGFVKISDLVASNDKTYIAYAKQLFDFIEGDEITKEKASSLFDDNTFNKAKEFRKQLEEKSGLTQKPSAHQEFFTEKQTGKNVQSSQTPQGQKPQIPPKPPYLKGSGIKK